jgi:hypothetical protein
MTTTQNLAQLLKRRMRLRSCFQFCLPRSGQNWRRFANSSSESCREPPAPMMYALPAASKPRMFSFCISFVNSGPIFLFSSWTPAHFDETYT